MAQDSMPPPAFSKWRTVFWPIRGYELKKLLPMLAMFFLISLIYSLLRNTKDALIVTAPGGGADLIPFLKVYGVIPASIVFILVFSKLSDHFGREKLFLICLMPFILYFSLFSFLYALREVIQPVAWMGHLRDHLPTGLLPAASVLRHWVLSMFYVISELWGSVALSLLFWGFANAITSVEEAERYYPLFGIGANLALIAIKLVNMFIHKVEGILVARHGMEPWSAYLAVLMATVVLSILIIMVIFIWFNHAVLTDPRFRPARIPDQVERKIKMSLKEKVKILLQSKTLKYIAIIVIAYGVAINLIEVTWKSYLGLQYPTPRAYQDFMSNFSLATGFTTLFLMLFVSSNVIRSFGWTVAALATPLVLAVTGVGFFGFILGQAALASLLERLALTPVAVGVWFGTIQNILSKGTKYALFDPTKEMAYIPLDREAQVKGKAAIDVVGARFGKAGGSLLQQILIGIYGSLLAITGQIAILLFLIIGIWIWADLRLGREFSKLTGMPR